MDTLSVECIPFYFNSVFVNHDNIHIVCHVYGCRVTFRDVK